MFEKIIADIVAASGLLSRLPMPWRRFQYIETGPEAAWAYPIAGAIIGVVALIVGWLSSALPAGLQAALVLATLIVATGAMHEDGLADSADGLWGGWDSARRLEIMKDSRIGTYGVLALCLSIVIRWTALTMVLTSGGLCALIGIAALSRAPMVALMAWLPRARPDGLSSSVGAPPARIVGLAMLTGVGIGLITMGWAVVAAIIAALAVAFCVAMIAKRKIGGQTGDILGATQQLCEIAILISLVALWT